jgi:hypothetical protein
MTDKPFTRAEIAELHRLGTIANGGQPPPRTMLDDLAELHDAGAELFRAVTIDALKLDKLLDWLESKLRKST